MRLLYKTQLWKYLFVQILWIIESDEYGENYTIRKACYALQCCEFVLALVWNTLLSEAVVLRAACYYMSACIQIFTWCYFRRQRLPHQAKGTFAFNMLRSTPHTAVRSSSLLHRPHRITRWVCTIEFKPSVVIVTGTCPLLAPPGKIAVGIAGQSLQDDVHLGHHTSTIGYHSNTGLVVSSHCLRTQTKAPSFATGQSPSASLTVCQSTTGVKVTNCI